MSTKLPEWPPLPYPLTPTLESECEYRELLADAAIARIEALVEVVTLWRKRMRHSMDDDDLQAVDDLLAACERKEAGR